MCEIFTSWISMWQRCWCSPTRHNLSAWSNITFIYWNEDTWQTLLISYLLALCRLMLQLDKFPVRESVDSLYRECADMHYIQYLSRSHETQHRTRFKVKEVPSVHLQGDFTTSKTHKLSQKHHGSPVFYSFVHGGIGHEGTNRCQL